MTSLLNKLQEIGNSIIALNNTRAGVSLNNLSAAGEAKLASLASGSGIPKSTINNTLTENNLTISVSEANKRLCYANSGATAFVYVNDVQNPTKLMNSDGSTYTANTSVFPYFTIESKVVKVYTAASTKSNAIRFSSNDVFGTTTITISGTAKYIYGVTEYSINYTSSRTLTISNIQSTKYIACGVNDTCVGNYNVSYGAPLNPLSGDIWYNLNEPVLKKFVTAWNAFDGAVVAKLYRNSLGNLEVEKFGCYRMLDAVSILNEIDSAKVPVGTVISFMGTEEPEGYLLMDGRELSRTTYSRLFSVIGTTQGAGDGSTTFNIADMTDGRYLMGSTVAGGSREAGLPNITGQVAGTRRMDNLQEVSTSALYWKVQNWVDAMTVHNATACADIGLDASRSNSIYGKSSTVTPLSLTSKYLIRY